MGLAPVSPQPGGNFLEAKDHLVSSWAITALSEESDIVVTKSGRPSSSCLCSLLKNRITANAWVKWVSCVYTHRNWRHQENPNMLRGGFSMIRNSEIAWFMQKNEDSSLQVQGQQGMKPEVRFKGFIAMRPLMCAFSLKGRFSGSTAFSFKFSIICLIDLTLRGTYGSFKQLKHF